MLRATDISCWVGRAFIPAMPRTRNRWTDNHIVDEPTDTGPGGYQLNLIDLGHSIEVGPLGHQSAFKIKLNAGNRIEVELHRHVSGKRFGQAAIVGRR
jgi:hypothetical protein